MTELHCSEMFLYVTIPSTRSCMSVYILHNVYWCSFLTGIQMLSIALLLPLTDKGKAKIIKRFKGIETLSEE
jgi:hypothetical protein